MLLSGHPFFLYVIEKNIYVTRDIRHHCYNISMIEGVPHFRPSAANDNKSDNQESPRIETDQAGTTFENRWPGWRAPFPESEDEFDVPPSALGNFLIRQAGRVRDTFEQTQERVGISERFRSLKSTMGNRAMRLKQQFKDRRKSRLYEIINTCTVIGLPVIVAASWGAGRGAGFKLAAAEMLAAAAGAFSWKLGRKHLSDRSPQKYNNLDFLVILFVGLLTSAGTDMVHNRYFPTENPDAISEDAPPRAYQSPVPGTVLQYDRLARSKAMPDARSLGSESEPLAKFPILSQESHDASANPEIVDLSSEDSASNEKADTSPLFQTPIISGRQSSWSLLVRDLKTFNAHPDKNNGHVLDHWARQNLAHAVERLVENEGLQNVLLGRSGSPLLSTVIPDDTHVHFNRVLGHQGFAAKLSYEISTRPEYRHLFEQLGGTQVAVEKYLRALADEYPHTA